MYQSFIGLEIHIQLLTRSKVFCSCRAAFGDEPNTNVCPVCMGYPGVLPTLNEEAIRMSYIVARALNCTLAERTVFDRKNYYYPDLPKNYQLSQFGSPVGENGFIDIELHKKKKRVRIHECHLEEDAGKMIHAGDMSLLDYNRAGTPLLEIVTEPDLEIGEEAELLLQQFRRMVRYLGVCDGNMEEGSMRCDANVSVNVRGEGLGRKVEIKNLNSSRFVRKALNFEIDRQQDILDRGGVVVQETRLWNENRDQSEPMRTKENAQDYRYFPEPDLPPFVPDPAFLASVEERLVELPLQRRDRLMREYALSRTHADFICDEKATAGFFEEAVSRGADPQAAATWLAADVKKHLNRTGLEIQACPLTPERFAELLILIGEERIHGKIAKQTLQEVFDRDLDPLRIIRENNWEQITDSAELGNVVDLVLRENKKAAAQIRQGDTRPMGFLVGQVMKKTSGRAEPKLVNRILNERLSFSIIEVLSFGGAISGTRLEDGMVVPGELVRLGEIFEADPEIPDSVRFEELQLGRFLSEEITPRDWAVLISSIAERIRTGNASGIVVAHGTDTLAYTASLLYWFFADTSVPIVLTAATGPCGGADASDTPAASTASDAVTNLKAAVLKTMTREPGVHVVYGEQDLSPVNLKFEGIFSEPARTGRFRNWNLETPVYRGLPVVRDLQELDLETLTTRLEEAVASVYLAKVFPGMRGESLIALMKTGVRYFILELYDTGTANLRETPYSLKRAFEYGEQAGARFFCTSQQEGTVDFSEYVTSHELWKEGAIPMGGLTTESAFTRLIAVLTVAETEDDVVRMMEEHE
jgi:aspartyl-tRNA(Asn)/glutamyl-tRNA(Gln) amidotransferase subunit B